MSVRKPNFSLNLKSPVCGTLLKVNLALNSAMVVSWYSLGTLNWGKAEGVLTLEHGRQVRFARVQEWDIAPVDNHELISLLFCHISSNVIRASWVLARSMGF